MLDDRKTAILRAVVQEYIGTGQPVGSTHIATAPDINVSSATVRNEMAVLEQEGFLAQPHTSAGRIPTDKGYRFFVDHLSQPGRLDDVKVSQVRDFFDGAHGRMEELLARTSHLVAGLTNYASVVLGPKVERAEVRAVQVVGLSARQAMVVAVMSNGSVESEHLEFDAGVSETRLGAVTVHMQRHLVGHALAGSREIPLSGDAGVDSICQKANAALRHVGEDDSVFVGGASSMASAFDAVDVVRQVLQTLEQQYLVVTLVRDILDRGLSVSIGAEHGIEPLASCSVVVAPVVVDGEQLGTIGVLGPTRMDYPQALATVEVVSDRLGRRLGES
ncbi:MAG: heat-inducible transcriptional repressor HrcA [Actinomycetota bacterium]|nr:heat-inducible transcriptional repressor HrcA [Actinomycetota bacterium]MDA3020371.1 heat-inducible transcriptional repressor HrcA [Actinomycetota bacterium]